MSPDPQPVRLGGSKVAVDPVWVRSGQRFMASESAFMRPEQTRVTHQPFHPFTTHHDAHPSPQIGMHSW